MFGNRWSLAALLLVLGASFAAACGPFFPWQLLDDRSRTLRETPVDSFHFEAAHLVPAPGDALHAVEEQTDKQRAKAEGEGLSAADAALLSEVQMAPSGDAAFDIGEALPPAVRFYAAGAKDFRDGYVARAAERFDAVLKLPDAERRPRAAWAAYMLGRSEARLGGFEEAARAFDTTRTLAIGGAPDPEGLAVASYGEEARLHLDRALALLDGDDAPPSPDEAARFAQSIASAVSLYARQAARGSESGVQSLRFVAEELLQSRSQVEAVIADPLTERLLVAYALARLDEDQVSDGWQLTSTQLAPVLTDIVVAIDARGIDHPAGGDRLAALAYRIGRYDLAARLAERTSGSLSAWVKAKLALQDGKLDAAAAFYAEASRSFPPAEEAGPLDRANRHRLIGEHAVVMLARGDYVDALDKLYPVAAVYWGDVVHLAERVLTVDELKRFVDARVPDASPSGYGRGPAWAAWRLRNLLARRLVRAGRIDEAVAYFGDPALRDRATAYGSDLHDAAHHWGRIGRAQAWYGAATLARRSGMEIMGYEAVPDFAVEDGAFQSGYGQRVLRGPFITDGERDRFAASAARPNERFHYRYVAVDEAVRAADLLPPRSQAFAAVLCMASGWMLSRQEDDLAWELYSRYFEQGPYVPWAAHFGRRCPEPDFAGAARLQRMEPVWVARHFARRHRWPIGIGLLLIGGAAIALRWRRRHGAVG